MFATAQEIHDASKAGKVIYDWRNVDRNRNNTEDTGYVLENGRRFLNYDGAVDLLQYCERQIKQEGRIFSKSNRPWYIIDLSTKLDPNEAWIGFEFETGFQNEAARRDVMSWVWDNTMHSCMDYEGAGNYPVEITFAPDTERAYTERTSDLHRLYAYITQRNYALVPYQYAGTHANISIPGMRKAATWKQDFVSGAINAIIQSGINRDRAFGRNPYGWGTRMDGAGHMEFKLFMSATNVAQFDHYVRVSIAIKNTMVELFAFIDQFKNNNDWNAFTADNNNAGWRDRLYRDLRTKYFSEWT